MDRFCAERFSFSHKASFFHVFLCEMLFVSCLKRPCSYFSPLLFSSHRRSVDPCVSIASDCCSQSSSVLFYVVFKSLYRCINAGFQCWQNLFLPLSLTHIVCQHHLWDAMPYARSIIFFFSGPFQFFSDPLQEWSQVYYEGGSSCIDPFFQASCYRAFIK